MRNSRVQAPTKKSFEELFEIAKKLEAAATASDAKDVSIPLNSLADAADEAKRSFSGS